MPTTSRIEVRDKFDQIIDEATGKSHGLSAGAKAGVIIGCIAGGLLTIFVVYYLYKEHLKKERMQRRMEMREELGSVLGLQQLSKGNARDTTIQSSSMKDPGHAQQQQHEASARIIEGIVHGNVAAPEDLDFTLTSDILRSPSFKKRFSQHMREGRSRNRALLATQAVTKFITGHAESAVGPEDSLSQAARPVGQETGPKHTLSAQERIDYMVQCQALELSAQRTSGRVQTYSEENKEAASGTVPPDSVPTTQAQKSISADMKTPVHEVWKGKEKEQIPEHVDYEESSQFLLPQTAYRPSERKDKNVANSSVKWDSPFGAYDRDARTEFQPVINPTLALPKSAKIAAPENYRGLIANPPARTAANHTLPPAKLSKSKRLSASTHVDDIEVDGESLFTSLSKADNTAPEPSMPDTVDWSAYMAAETTLTDDPFPDYLKNVEKLKKEQKERRRKVAEEKQWRKG